MTIYIAVVVGCLECAMETEVAAFRERSDAEAWLEERKRQLGEEGFYAYFIREVEA